MSGRGTKGTKWAGAILYVSLLIGATVYFFNHDELDKIEKVGSLIAAFIALLGAPTVVDGAWNLWRRQGQSSPPSLDEAVGQLAEAVRKQWDAEAALRGVNLYPLPVAWRAAEEDLAEPWPLLTELAHAWPGGPPGDPARWPSCAEELADDDVRIGELFTDRVPTRRLVVLGEPGAGKSVLLMRLLQDLLVSRTDDDPVPVIFSLASWNPEQPLKAWIADQLRRTHPGLRSPAPPTTTAGDTGDLARALVETRRILPLLDGFDELPGGLHGRALDSLNRALPARQPVVLAARATEYRAALRGPGPTVRLNGAAAIQLLPLDPGKAADYLRRDAGGPPGAARWDAVAAELGTDSPVGQALSTPLGLFLARTIYNLRPDHTPGAEAPDPDELCNVQVFPDRAAVDQYLFQTFIPAAYAPDAHHPPRWTAEQAHHAFVTLARLLEDQRRGSPDLAWWEVKLAVPRYIHGLLRGLVAGLVGGLVGGLIAGPEFGLVGKLGVGLGLGLLGGLGVGLVVGRAGPDVVTPSTGLRFKTGRLRAWLVGIPRAGLRTGPVIVLGAMLGAMLVRGLVRGLEAGLEAGIEGGLEAGLKAGLETAPGAVLEAGLAGVFVGLFVGLVGVLLFGPVVGLATGLRPKMLDLTSSIEPLLLLRSDRKTLIAYALAVVFASGLVFGLIFGFYAGPGAGLGYGLASGLMFGAMFGPMGEPSESAWLYFVEARAWLAARRKAPYRLMLFLRDAHEHRGVLRQVGPVYQFRHMDLQRHLARQHHP